MQKNSKHHSLCYELKLCYVLLKTSQTCQQRQDNDIRLTTLLDYHGMVLGKKNTKARHSTNRANYSLNYCKLFSQTTKHWTRSSQRGSMFLPDLMLMGMAQRVFSELYSKMWFWLRDTRISCVTAVTNLSSMSGFCGFTFVNIHEKQFCIMLEHNCRLCLGAPKQIHNSDIKHRNMFSQPHHNHLTCSEQVQVAHCIVGA